MSDAPTARPKLSLLLIVFPMLLLGQCALAATPVKPVIQVGSYHCPPFVIKHDDDTYSGLSILLWERISENLGLQYQITDYSLKDLLEAVANKKLAVGISCISITPERELILDFSHSFYETHLAIAVKKQGHLTTIKNIITNKNLLIVLGIFFAAAATVGGIYYLLEHRVNEKLYSMPSRKAQLIEGFILGLLFITKGPFNYFEFKTLPGRVLTVFLAIFTTIFIASITAILASTFTLGLLSSDIRGPGDLANIPVGAKLASTSSEYLTSQSIVHRTYIDTDQMLVALESNEVDAIVADAAVLKYLLKKSKEKGEYQDLMVLPYQFEKQNYGFVIEDKSEYIEQLNRALLKVRRSPEWRQALHEYFAERH